MSIPFEELVCGSRALEVIVSFLGNVYDARALSFTCRTIHAMIGPKMYNKLEKSNIEQIVKKYRFESLEAFNAFMRSNCLVLSGSSALEAFGRRSDELVEWRSSDLDLYFDSCPRSPYVADNTLNFVKNLSPINAVLKKMGFKRVVDEAGQYYDHESSMICVTYLYPPSTAVNEPDVPNTKKIQIIFCNRPVVEVVKNFDLGFLSNIYTTRNGGEMICLNPKSVLTRSCYPNLGIAKTLDVYRRLHSIGIQDRVIQPRFVKKQERFKKYEGRGFTICGRGTPSKVYMEHTFFLQNEIKKFFALPSSMFSDVMVRWKRSLAYE